MKKADGDLVDNSWNNRTNELWNMSLQFGTMKDSCLVDHERTEECFILETIICANRVLVEEVRETVDGSYSKLRKTSVSFELFSQN